MRRASLVFSLTLIVAIAVGYVARRSELAGERDQRLAAAADLGAAQLDALVDTVEVAGRAGSDPADTAAAIVSIRPTVGVCVVSAEDEACDGEGPRPLADVVADHRAALAAGEAPHATAEVSVYESMLTIDVDGPTVAVIARMPADAIARPAPDHDVAVWATTFLPAGASVGGFAVDGDVRQTATAVGSVPSLFVVAAGADSVELPLDEQRFYVIIFALAVVLLLLAGITLVVEQRNLLERASFDQLTKLPNRSEFERRTLDALAAAERTGTGLCLMLFDLNGFKQINDTYGHHAGDEMLKVIGTRLRKAVRDGDVVARWGGDEFVVVMPGIDNEAMGAKRAHQLAEQVGGRTRLDGIAEPLRVKVSVGVAVWPTHGGDLQSLVSAADQAMYQAKRDGLTCWIADEPSPRPLATLPG